MRDKNKRLNYRRKERIKIKNKNIIVLIASVIILLFTSFIVFQPHNNPNATITNEQFVAIKLPEENNEETVWEINLNEKKEQLNSAKLYIELEQGLNKKSIEVITKNEEDIEIEETPTGYLLELPNGNTNHHILVTTTLQPNESNHVIRTKLETENAIYIAEENHELIEQNLDETNAQETNDETAEIEESLEDAEDQQEGTEKNETEDLETESKQEKETKETSSQDNGKTTQAIKPMSEDESTLNVELNLSGPDDQKLFLHETYPGNLHVHISGDGALLEDSYALVEINSDWVLDITNNM